MKLAFVTCLWKRHRLAREMLRWHAQLKEELASEGIHLTLVAVGSEGRRSQRLAERAGWHYVEYPNMPLSDKFNAGIRYAAAPGRVIQGGEVVRLVASPEIDAVGVIGSDDFVTADYFREVKKLLDEGAHYIVPNGCHFLDTHTRRALYLGSHTTGGGRVLTQDLLARLDWKPYAGGALSGIDATMQDKVTQVFGTNRYAMVGPLRLLNTNPGQKAMLLGVKTDTNMWTFERMAQGITSRYVELDCLDAFGTLGERLKDWHLHSWLRKLKN